jgi:hypothetical protein
MPNKLETITVKNQRPHPSGEVEVTPDGTIIFDNKDNKDYLLRLRAKDNSTKDLPLPANGQATVPIKKDDEFMYDILNADGSTAVLSASASVSGGSTVTANVATGTGTGGGPIKN